MYAIIRDGAIAEIVPSLPGGLEDGAFLPVTEAMEPAALILVDGALAEDPAILSDILAARVDALRSEVAADLTNIQRSRVYDIKAAELAAYRAAGEEPDPEDYPLGAARAASLDRTLAQEMDAVEAAIALNNARLVAVEGLADATIAAIAVAGSAAAMRAAYDAADWDAARSVGP